MPSSIMNAPGGCRCGGVLCVRVVDACGPGANVAGYEVTTPGGSPAVTDASGLACITGLSPGEHTVTVDRDGCGGSVGPVDTTHGSASTTISVSCDDRPGTVCVSITTTCTTSRAGLSVSVNGPTGSASATTDAFGAACVSVPPGVYTVTVTRADCTTVSGVVTITCGGSATVAGVIGCGERGTATVRATGCFNSLAAGTTISVTGPGGFSVAGEMGSGVVPDFDLNPSIGFKFPVPTTGAYTITATPPNERLKPVVWTGTLRNCHTSPQIVNLGLPRADGYICCDILKTVSPPHPYPIKGSLRITDRGGSIISPMLGGTAPLANCYVRGCGMRSMEQVGDGPGYFWQCWDSILLRPGGLAGGVDETKIGPGESSVSYYLPLGTGTADRGQQVIPAILREGYVNGEYMDDCPLGTDQYLVRRWIYQRACGSEGNLNDLIFTADRTINSLTPLSVTYTFTGGDGNYGPMPWPVYDAARGNTPGPLTGSPYSPTVLLTEE